MNLNIKLMQRIGYTLIIVSLILFSVSIVSVYSNSSSFEKTINPNSSITLAMSNNVSAGDDILYSITPSNGTFNITAFLSGPSGQSIGFSNATGNSFTLTKETVSPQGGLWKLNITNHNGSVAYLKITLGHISYTTLSMFLLGFAFLPSGIALVVLSLVIRRREQRSPKYRF